MWTFDAERVLSFLNTTTDTFGSMCPTWVMRLAKVVGTISIVALSGLYVFQEKLLYLPVIPGTSNDFPYLPDKFHLIYEDIWLTAKDGTKLHCWHIHGHDSEVNTSNEKKPVIMFFQENAGNMSWRLPFLSELVRRLHCSVFVLSYRGYGKSESSPYQAGLEMDSEAAFAHILERNDVDHDRIVTFGKSLGGAVALHVASKYKSQVRAACIENTFTSVENMVSRVLPVLGYIIGKNKPMNFLVRSDKWCSLALHSVSSAAPTVRLFLASKRGEEAGVVEDGDYFFDLVFGDSSFVIIKIINEF